MQFPQDFVNKKDVWFPKDTDDSISYSDGTESENYLEQVFLSSRDKSYYSQEIATAIRDWPSKYHLDVRRANLLKPLNLQPHQSILELGAGCGAITAYLGEQGNNVFAVEGGVRRAKINALRCQNFANVKVICANFQGLQFDQKFDVVTLIGVLEYSGVYLDSAKPHLEALQLAKSHLKPDGILILAIENRLGLKYFAGALEDHTGLFADGLEGYTSGTKICTFGRKELTKLVNDAGFQHLKFLYPFPDYKLPHVILNLAEANHQQSPPSLYQQLHLEANNSNGQYPHHVFQEYLVSKELEKNGLLADFSNSFLVIASPSCQLDTFENQGILAWRYNTNRAKKFATAMQIQQDDLGNKSITRQHVFLDESMQNRQTTYSQKLTKSDAWYEGKLLSEELLFAIKSDSSGKKLTGLLQEWLDFLNQVKLQREQLECVPPNYFDCNPNHLMRRNDGSLHYFDDEWVAPNPINIKFVVFRGLMHLHPAYATWVNAYWKALIPNPSAKCFISWVFAQLALSLSDAEVDTFLQQEADFQQEIMLASPETYETLRQHIFFKKHDKPTVEKDLLPETSHEKSLLQKIREKLKLF